jgi:peptide-methionine (S)-S-oxide reductase
MTDTMGMKRPILAAMLTLTIAALAAGAATAAPDTKGAGAQRAPQKETATFAAGCFWSMEAIFKQLKGVYSAQSGYSGGKVAHPTYEQVCTGSTGHAETLNIVFDPKVITYKELLEVLLTMRDPTTVNRQGNDEGTEYRSVIFYRNEEQRKDAKEMIAKFNAAHIWPNLIVTEVQPFTVFYKAEDYHTDYYRLHPNEGYCRTVIAPEIAEFRSKFKSKLKK